MPTSCLFKRFSPKSNVFAHRKPQIREAGLVGARQEPAAGERVMRIGLIGLGQMGSGMAKALLKAGHDVTVWNRSHGKTHEIRAAGAEVASNPGEAARG